MTISYLNWFDEIGCYMGSARHVRLFLNSAQFAYALYAHTLFSEYFTQLGVNVTWRSVFLHAKNVSQSVIGLWRAKRMGGEVHL